MPWKRNSDQEQRWGFVQLVLLGKKSLAELCRGSGISRKTAYKWVARFKESGRRGLHDQTRSAHRIHNRPKPKWLARIRRCKNQHPGWGAPKIHWVLMRRFGRSGSPSESAVSRWLKHWGLTRERRRRIRKGVSILRPALQAARLAFQDIFQEYGIPRVIRSDNGSPFGSTGALGLTLLSAWWVKLGIRVEFIEPGHPEQNGAHEQMHRIYKAETLNPVGASLRIQKQRTRQWCLEYNHERPHEALAMGLPSDHYRKSRRRMAARLSPWLYPAGWKSRRVKDNGMIVLDGRSRFVGHAFGKERVGLKRAHPGRWEVYFGPWLAGELHDIDWGGIRAVTYRNKKTE